MPHQALNAHALGGIPGQERGLRRNRKVRHTLPDLEIGGAAWFGRYGKNDVVAASSVVVSPCETNTWCSSIECAPSWKGVFQGTALGSAFAVLPDLPYLLIGEEDWYCSTALWPGNAIRSPILRPRRISCLPDSCPCARRHAEHHYQSRFAASCSRAASRSCLSGQRRSRRR